MKKEDYLDIERKLGYTFENKGLLRQAFVRRTFALENGGADNEILEFVGDQALDAVATRLLVTRYGEFAPLFTHDEKCALREFCCTKTEGEPTELKKELVKRETLARCITSLGFAQYLIMGKGDIKNRIDREEKVKEDVFEALIGAVTIDSNWNLDAIYTAVDHLLHPDEILHAHPLRQDN